MTEDKHYIGGLINLDRPYGFPVNVSRLHVLS